jgi:D-serine deaminase-like pyridoxal phosphate-dependent protein
MESRESAWYIFDGASNLDTPALVVFPERVQENIRTAIRMTGGADRLRPHAKTHKSPDLTRLLLREGIRQFKCSTIAEAEMLASENAPDILLAYQPVGPKLDRFLRLQQAFPSIRFSCLVDDWETGRSMAAKAGDAGITLRLYLDLDVGMHRTGILTGDEAIQLYLTLAAQPGVEMIGLHAYDGHIADADLSLRTRRVEEAFAPVYNMRQALLEAGMPRVEIIAGGMPSFPILAQQPDLICSPGTFVYFDQSYSEKLADTAFIPAAVVLSRIISKPAPNRITTDLGHKSVASENSLDKRVHWLNAGALVPVGHSEEHFFFETADASVFKIGDLLVGLPWHICPTVALYEKAITVSDGKISGEWRTPARDRTITL